MGCCSCCDEPDEAKIRMVFAKNEDRGCIGFDLIFLIAFGVFWVAMISTTSSAVADGDPNKLIYGVNWEGDICGYTDSVKDLEFAAWPYYLDYEVKVCLNSCEETQTSSEIPSAYQHTSERFLWYCVPTILNTDGSSISLGGDFDSVSAAAGRAVGDLFTSKWIILASPAMAVLMSFVFIKMMERCAGALVWAVLFLFMVAGFLGAYVLLKMAGEANDSAEPERAKAMYVLGYALLAATVVFVCVIFCARNAIRVAIEVVEASCAALDDMKLLILFPFLPMLVGLVYMVYWIIMCLFIFSNSNPETVDTPTALTTQGAPWSTRLTYTDYVWDESLQNVFAAHFFHLLWNVQFLIYFSYLVTAGAVAQWYFAENKDDAEGYEKKRGDGDGELPDAPVSASCWRAFRYHLGSVAFGSLILAIIQFIRAVVAYIEHKTKSKDPNCFQKVMWKAIHCCLYCAECCLDKISKNAYVWMAIYGDNFLSSACHAFSLLLKNIVRIAAINTVGAFILFIGKILVSLLTMGACGLITYAAYQDEISSVAMPCFVYFVIGFLVATLFMNVFETTIDTVFLCFLVDETNHKDNNVPMRGPPELTKLVETHAAKSRAEAEEKQRLKELKFPDGPNNPVPSAEPNTNAPAAQYAME